GGVPISMYRDLHIQRKLTARQFSECIGLNGGGKIADKIANYIIAELDKPVNTGVIKVFLAGGLVETYGLVDYIREKVGEKHKKVKILTFDDKTKSASADTILSYEDGIYASAVGGAIVALNDYDIKMGLSFSYGTWGNVSTGNGTQKSKCLLNFVYRGTEVEYDNQEFWSPFSFDIGNTDCINNEEIFASTVTAESLENREKPNRAKINYYAFGGSYVLEVGNINSTERKNAQKAFALTTVAGGAKSKIFIFHNGKRVRVNDTVKLCEGVKIDRDGHATPIIKNAYLETDKTKVSITYLTTGTTKRVYAREITFGFVDVKGFSATIN
ncbi:MAG: hypothetical protein IJY70_00670, partial [Clostridia bacterium]|nr:hypothetical protein [Clostridia bacterium]